MNVLINNERITIRHYSLSRQSGQSMKFKDFKSVEMGVTLHDLADFQKHKVVIDWVALWVTGYWCLIVMDHLEVLSHRLDVTRAEHSIFPSKSEAFYSQCTCSVLHQSWRKYYQGVCRSSPVLLILPEDKHFISEGLAISLRIDQDDCIPLKK